MGEKIKVGNAEIEKTNYDYFSFMYEKMPKEYVVADLVSKCEDYDKLYKNYEMKDLQIEEMRKELINNDEYIGKLQIEYDKEIERLHYIIKEVRVYIENENYKEENICMINGVDILEILDKVGDIK